VNDRILIWRNWIVPTLVVAALALGSCRATAQCVPTPAGLIGWWPADGNANDLASTNNGTLEGGATDTATGYVGSCFTFDGTNGFVQIPGTPAFHPTNLTVEAWVRFDGLDSAGSGGSPPGEQYMVFKQNTRTTFFEGFFLGKGRRAGRDFFVFEVSSALGQESELDSAITVTTNQWYHVAGVRGPDFIQLYVNGEFDSQTNVTFPQDYGTNDLYFGTSGQVYWDHKLKGELDEVSLHNRALNSDEIGAIYNAGHQGKCKAPTIVSIELSTGTEQVPQMFPLLTIAGLAGQSYGIQTTCCLGTANQWVGLTNLTLDGPADLWQSPAPASDAHRFYRVLPGSISIP